ncbi:MAG: hypothetical protein RJA02_1926, partial [Armatimonadota bacterium]
MTERSRRLFIFSMLWLELFRRQFVHDHSRPLRYGIFVTA